MSSFRTTRKGHRALVLALAVCLCGMVLGACSQQGRQLTAADLDTVIASLTLEEKVDLCLGIGSFWYYQGQGIAGAAGGVEGVERWGIPRSYLADGPSGLRIYKAWPGTDIHVTATAFPSPILLASSWDVDLAREMGAAIGVECRENGVASILGPAMNILRFPLGGRTAEYFSEDPLLTGLLAAAYVEGTQSQGVGTSIKHFAANSQETARKVNDARVSERALREIYLRGFEIAVRRAQPWTVMSAYNKINGVPASENHWLLEDVLRGEWGFQGLVMTDWDAGYDGARQVAAGNDLCQPASEVQRGQILEALESGALSEETLDRSVRRVLEYQLKTTDYRGVPASGNVPAEAHAALARRIAAESAVLLRCEHNALPLKAGAKVALYGNAAYPMGSAEVQEADTDDDAKQQWDDGEVSLRRGLVDAGLQLDHDLTDRYQAYVESDTTLSGQVYEVGGIVFTQFSKDSNWPEMTLTAAQWHEQAERNDCAIILLTQSAGESHDNEPEDFELSEGEKGLIRQACDAYHRAGKAVVVILDIAVPMETTSWRDLPDAIVCTWQGGQEKGHAMADVLSGAVNPSGRLTVSFPMRLSDEPAYANFPMHVDYDWEWAQMGFLTGKEDARFDDAPVRNVHYTDYAEGIYVGYRHFDTRRVPVAYPFGHGLSYTTFNYSDASVESAHDAFTATVTVTNTGQRAGREVVQLYVSAPAGGDTLDRPAKELRAFAKTRLLQPGESQVLTMTFTPYQLSSYDEASACWSAPAGTYTALFAASAADIRQRASFQLEQDFREDVHSDELRFP